MLVRYGQNAEGKQVRQALVYTKDEHKIALEKIDIEAVKIIQRLNSQGFEAYIVGGAVRDLLIGHVPKDFDIATSAEPSKIRKMFRNSRVIGRRFRLVHIFFGEKIYEVSTFRSTEDGSIGNKFGTIDEDVHRRDFTLNALYYDPIHELVIDYVDGVKDIRAKKIRPIIPLQLIFSEDPVRMIRAIKYAAMTDSGIPFFLQLQIRKNAHLLEFVSPSRITEEINKIIFSGHASDIIKKLLDFLDYCTLIYKTLIFVEMLFEILHLYNFFHYSYYLPCISIKILFKNFIMVSKFSISSSVILGISRVLSPIFLYISSNKEFSPNISSTLLILAKTSQAPSLATSFFNVKS